MNTNAAPTAIPLSPRGRGARGEGPAGTNRRWPKNMKIQNQFNSQIQIPHFDAPNCARNARRAAQIKGPTSRWEPRETRKSKNNSATNPSQPSSPLHRRGEPKVWLLPRVVDLAAAMRPGVRSPRRGEARASDRLEPCRKARSFTKVPNELSLASNPHLPYPYRANKPKDTTSR